MKGLKKISGQLFPSLLCIATTNYNNAFRNAWLKTEPSKSTLGILNYEW